MSEMCIFCAVAISEAKTDTDCDNAIEWSKHFCDGCRARRAVVDLWRERLGANFIAAGLGAEIARLNGASIDGSSCSIDKRIRRHIAERFDVEKAGAP